MSGSSVVTDTVGLAGLDPSASSTTADTAGAAIDPSASSTMTDIVTEPPRGSVTYSHVRGGVLPVTPAGSSTFRLTRGLRAVRSGWGPVHDASATPAITESIGPVHDAPTATSITESVGPVHDASATPAITESIGPVLDHTIDGIPLHIDLSDPNPDDVGGERNRLVPQLVEFKSPNVYGLERDLEGNISGFKY